MDELLDRPVTKCPPDPRLLKTMGYSALPTRHGDRAQIGARFLPNPNPDWRLHMVSGKAFNDLIMGINGIVSRVSLKKFLEMIEESA